MQGQLILLSLMCLLKCSKRLEVLVPCHLICEAQHLDILSHIIQHSLGSVPFTCSLNNKRLALFNAAVLIPMHRMTIPTVLSLAHQI